MKRALNLLALACASRLPRQSRLNPSQWVQQGQSGLIYQQDSRGDRILNCRSARYKSGAELPICGPLNRWSTLTGLLTVAAIAGDD